MIDDQVLLEDDAKQADLLDINDTALSVTDFDAPSESPSDASESEEQSPLTAVPVRNVGDF